MLVAPNKPARLFMFGTQVTRGVAKAIGHYADAKTKPYANGDQAHHIDRILLAKEFLVKTQHTLVFVPCDKVGASATARSLEMRDRRGRYEHDFQILVSETHAPVQILAMQEIAFIPAPYLINGVSTHQHQCARNGFDFDRSGWQRLFIQMKVEK